MRQDYDECYFSEGAFLGRWERKHGDDPDKWPLPPGQPMTWQKWARELSAEAVRQGFHPQGLSDFLPKNEEDIRDMARTCWIEDWLLGKTPAQIIKEQAAFDAS